jgi:uncharacterized integral membrane protein
LHFSELNYSAGASSENGLTLCRYFCYVLAALENAGMVQDPLFFLGHIRTGEKMLKIILAALFIILAATFSTLNREEITLRYFFGWSTPPFPLFLLLLASLVVGIVLGFSVDWGERWKLRAKARELERQVKVLREDIEALAPQEKPPEPPLPSPEASKTAPS